MPSCPGTIENRRSHHEKNHAAAGINNIADTTPMLDAAFPLSVATGEELVVVAEPEPPVATAEVAEPVDVALLVAEAELELELLPSSLSTLATSWPPETVLGFEPALPLEALW